MNKGETIRLLLAQGISEAEILNQVSTTANSIRWHKSKMKLATLASHNITATVVGFVTIGQTLEQHGLAEEVLAGLKKIGQECHYESLCAWRFVTNHTVTGRFGQCRYNTKTIEVHHKLLNLKKDFRQTILHECAHALDAMIHGRSSKHGAPWQRIMIALGQPPLRCGGHTNEASKALLELRVKKAYAIWECIRCGKETPIQRKRKYPADCYTHRGCGGEYRVKTC